MQALKTEIRVSHPKQYALVDALYRNREEEPQVPTQESFVRNLVLWPNGSAVPDKLISKIYNGVAQNKWIWKQVVQFALIEVDLNNDGHSEYID